jgi:uncharacterized membrane protein (UPF0127 family)
MRADGRAALLARCAGGSVEPMDDPPTFAVSSALTRGQRARGLAGRDLIDPREGLRIPRCRSVHTVGMRFALDLVWLDRDDVVVRVDRDVPPQRMRTCLRARSVVELAAGQADAYLAAAQADASLVAGRR